MTSPIPRSKISPAYPARGNTMYGCNSYDTMIDMCVITLRVLTSMWIVKLQLSGTALYSTRVGVRRRATQAWTIIYILCVHVAQSRSPLVFSRHVCLAVCRLHTCAARLLRSGARPAAVPGSQRTHSRTGMHYHSSASPSPASSQWGPPVRHRASSWDTTHGNSGLPSKRLTRLCASHTHTLSSSRELTLHGTQWHASAS